MGESGVQAGRGGRPPMRGRGLNDETGVTWVRARGKRPRQFDKRSPSPLPSPPGEYVFSAPTNRGRSAALRPLHRPPVPGARENPQRHRDCATRKRRKRRAPFPGATTTVNTYRGEGNSVWPVPRSSEQRLIVLLP